VFRAALVDAAAELVLLAADPAWKTKSVQQWDEEDTKSGFGWLTLGASARWLVILLELTAQRRSEGRHCSP
jgi:hypothetical protein